MSCIDSTSCGFLTQKQVFCYQCTLDGSNALCFDGSALVFLLFKTFRKNIVDSINILPELSGQLAVAQRLAETLVFRTNGGMVFTIEIGESILPSTQSQLGAKVSQISPTLNHLGIVQNESRDSVIEDAQKMIFESIQKNSAVPSPHMSIPGDKAFA